MDKDNLPKLVREVLVELKSIDDFILTGSYALAIHGLLDRKPKDLDIVSSSPLLTRSLNQIAINITPAFNKIEQQRFIYPKKGNEIYVDLFNSPKIPFIEIWVPKVGNLKVAKAEYIYLCKLKQNPKKNKTIKDLIDYFLILNNR